MPPTLESDRAYCRATLPRVSRTFALNIRLLRGALGEAVRTAYLWCRAADALEDSWPGSPAEIEERFGLLLDALGDDGEAAETLARRAAAQGAGAADLELVAHLPRVWRAWMALPAADGAIIAAGVRALAGGMCRYAAREAERGVRPGRRTAYLDDLAELHDYCWVVAGCVGEMLTRLFARRAPGPEALERRRLELAPVLGEALQLTNILLDWPNDVRRGRCYLPNQWLAEFELRPEDLVATDRPGVRELAARLETLAHAALARVPDYLATIPARHVRYRLFCLWPALWARQSLRHARRDPEFPWGAHRPRLPKHELMQSAIGSALVAHRDGWLRRLYAACG